MFQTEKAVVRDLYAAMKGVAPDGIAAVLRDHTAADWQWRGMHPFYEQRGAQDVARVFWEPLLGSLSRLQRREDIFFAGENSTGEGVWVVSMGHLMGLFDALWLGIVPTRKMAFLRYCEFNRVVDGQIAETMLHVDIPHLMMQAGQNPFPPQTGAQMVQPGPMTNDGMLHEAQDPETGAATLALINKMIRDIGTWGGDLTIEDELARTWADDMIWWGPAGIGASYTIERYAKQHAGPFRAAFYDRTGTGHVARLAEGNYGGFFGWPNFRAKQRGGFMGMAGNDTDCDFRVIDIYRRDGDTLAENWIFIDLLYWLMQQGDDVLTRMSAIAGTDYTPPDYSEKLTSN